VCRCKIRHIFFIPGEQINPVVQDKTPTSTNKKWHKQHCERLRAPSLFFTSTLQTTYITVPIVTRTLSTTYRIVPIVIRTLWTNGTTYSTAQLSSKPHSTFLLSSEPYRPITELCLLSSEPCRLITIPPYCHQHLVNYLQHRPIVINTLWTTHNTALLSSEPCRPLNTSLLS